MKMLANRVAVVRDICSAAFACRATVSGQIRAQYRHEFDAQN